jgi:DnaJ-class molecular chaperone
MNKKKTICENCKGDGVVYTFVNEQDKEDPFSLPEGAYEDECEECGGTGYYND